ncbi:hypothetical protein ACGFYQ_18260 [Streptomyces sp. NPDC048258]|uniref:hypothetical protein n=1 Tax=Streptomyces sp. NPDC048258 TaxID=3365527 RepID=UPI00371D907F
MDPHAAPVTRGAVACGAVRGEAVRGEAVAREAVAREAVKGEAQMRDALADWRRDGLLLCLLPMFCWPAVVAAVLTRPVALLVLLSPVVLGVRELLAARRAGRVLRDPAARWTSYGSVVVRARWRPPVLVLDAGPALSLGLLGRRVLPPRPWLRTAPAPDTVEVWLAGDPSAGGVLWTPAARRLGRARPVGAPRSRPGDLRGPARPGTAPRRVVALRKYGQVRAAVLRLAMHRTRPRGPTHEDRPDRT